MFGIREQQKATGDYKFIIGIDLGEDSVSASFTEFEGDSSYPEVEDITRWPRQRANFFPRTPTALLYRKNHSGEGYLLEAWAANAKNNRYRFADDSVYFSNLFSDKDSAIKSKYSDQFPIKRLFTDFLRELLSYIRIYMQRIRSTTALDPCYCIAIPATCDNDTKSIIREAAIDAGILKPSDEPGRLILTSERNARLAYLTNPASHDENLVKYNSPIVVCDVGDKVVDVTTYKMTVDGEQKYFEELKTNRRNLDLSSRIDDLARIWIQGYLDPILKNDDESPVDWTLQTFRESIKPNFGDDDEEECYMPVSAQIRCAASDIPDYIKDGYLILTYQQMSKYIFDPVVNEVLTLIDEHLKRVPETKTDRMILIDRSSSTPYFRERVRVKFANRVGRITSVPRAEVAISKGATLYSLNTSTIIYNVASRSYGVRCNKKFRDGIDNPVNLLIRPNGQRRCKNRLDFFVTKNTKMESSYCFEREYSAIYPNNTRSILYSYDGEGDALPDYVDNNGVEEVLRFTIEMPVIPGKKDGDKVPYKTRIYIRHTEIKIEVLIGGETQVHTVNISGKPPKPLVEGKTIPGYDEIINHLRQQGFDTNKYTGENIDSRYLQEA